MISPPSRRETVMIARRGHHRTLRGLVALLLLLMGLTAAASSAQAAAAGRTGSGAAVRLPRDDAPHQTPNEWWYFSGHLTAVDSAGHVHQYGFEYVTFQFLGIAPEPVYIGNLSVSDLTRRQFVYSAQEDSYATPATTNSFDLHTGAWTMRGGGRRDVLHAALPGYDVQLRLRSTERPALHGDHGIIPFGPFGTSAYYSRTALSTTGSIVDHGVAMRVVGVSWMDHRWGAFDFASGGGWDWFSVQLTDGRQYMLYFIRDSTGRIVQTVGTEVAAHHNVGTRVTHLAPATFGERALGSWHSDVTQITYSSGWQVRVPGGSLTISPDLVDQELDLRTIQGVAYWEGDVAVRGHIDGRRASGVGYTEINPAGQP
jgi:predicted secreted hydrolase